MSALRETLNDPKRLASLHRAGLLDTPPEEAFDRLTRLASRILDVPVALVSLVDDQRQFFKSAVGLSDPLATARGTPLSHSYCQFVVASGTPLVVDDARKHDLVRNNPAIEDYDAISYCGVPIVDAEGRTLGTLCVIDHEVREWSDEQVAVLRDVARSVIAEVQLRLLAADLEDTNAALREFIAMASHDIRNPLAVILGFAQLLDDGPGEVDEEERRELIEIIRNEADHANRLVNDLLEVTKLEAKVVEPRREQIDVDQAVKRVAHGHPEAQRIEVSVTEGLRVFVDPDHLQRILVNLVGNAFKYGAPPVCIGAREEAGAVVLTVSDAGEGVPLEFVPRLFEKFERSEEAKASAAAGTGLGLAIVKGLTEANGGSIRYEAAEPRGARFVLEFPAP